jgi:hypothetical protein
MKSKYHDYSVYFQKNAIGQFNIILTQKHQIDGIENTLEIPIDEIQDIISMLRSAKKETNSAMYDNVKIVEPLINSDILDEMIPLYLSGVTIDSLAKQFGISYENIKYNLEKCGIIIFD